MATISTFDSVLANLELMNVLLKVVIGIYIIVGIIQLITLYNIYRTYRKECDEN